MGGISFSLFPSSFPSRAAPVASPPFLLFSLLPTHQPTYLSHLQHSRLPSPSSLCLGKLGSSCTVLATGMGLLRSEEFARTCKWYLIFSWIPFPRNFPPPGSPYILTFSFFLLSFPDTNLSSALSGSLYYIIYLICLYPSFLPNGNPKSVRHCLSLLFILTTIL